MLKNTLSLTHAWHALVPGFLKEHTQWKPLKEDWEQKIRPFAEKKGAQVYGTIGKFIENFNILKCQKIFLFKKPKII